MMGLHMPRKNFNTVADHLIYHAARQRRHENHRPDADGNGAQHDVCPTVIAPQIAPRQSQQDCKHAHQATLIESTGFCQFRRTAG